MQSNDRLFLVMKNKFTIKVWFTHSASLFTYTGELVKEQEIQVFLNISFLNEPLEALKIHEN